MIVSDAPSCGITHDSHSDDRRGVIDNCIIFYNAGHRSCISKHFIFSDTYKWAQKARVFVPEKDFQPSIM
jgi:hypothetical protein